MLKRYTFLFLMMAVLFPAAWAQYGVVVNLDATTNGTSDTVSGTTQYYLRDEELGDVGNYAPDCDYSITVYGECDNPNVLNIFVESFDVAPGDTVYIYDGPSTIYPLLVAANNDNSIIYNNYYSSARNGYNALTVRIKSNSDSNVGRGFSFLFKCALPCEMSTPVIDEQYTLWVNGTQTGTGRLKTIVEYDTTITIRSDGRFDTTYHTNRFLSADICEGECVKLTAHGEYTNNTGIYTPTDATSTFSWSFGNGENLSAVGATSTGVLCYDESTCYYLTLSMYDEHECPANGVASAYVRIAPNPIKSIADLESVCANDSIFISMGFDEYSVITFDQIDIENSHSRVNNTKTFIPDGPYCSTPCYEATVTFNEFPVGSTIESASDICSVCVNYEHSFMGDYRLAVKCPNGQMAVLKYGNANYDNLAPSGKVFGTSGGSGTYTGFPYGGENDYSYDGNGGGYCDSIYNMYGDGLDYCFSRNGDYTLADGYPANTTTDLSSHYITDDNAAYKITTTHRYGVIPRPYADAGTSCGTLNVTTKRPSDHENKSDYYMPHEDFSSLVGCPLNGDWQMVVCDFWSSDNGWVFNWSMDLCNSQTDNYNCSYKVDIDSLYWSTNPRQSDTYRGEYRGLHILPTDDPYAIYVSSVDTGGVFDLRLNAIDDFGCLWDTTLAVTTKPLMRSLTVVNKCPSEEYTWVDGNTYIDAPTPLPTWIFPAQTGCDSVVSLQIVNDKIPEAQIDAVPTYVSYENTQVTLYDASKGSFSRTWYFDDQTSNESIATFTYPTEKDSVRAMLIANSQYNCPDTAYVTIPMDKTLLWASTNAFTPDRDDFAYFYFKGYNVLDDVQVYIYNRMGALVASWVGFEGRWDGHHAGERCSMGAYTWVIKYHSSFEPSRWHYKTGTVTLLR